MAVMKPLVGVNLGGWLVLEKWITPSVFAGTNAVDEYTYCLQADAAQRRQLTQFRNTFITEADFAWLAEQGVEAVRLPVGYWAFGDAEPYLPTLQYVDQAFDWAASHGLKILLDLHGAPGSQNGEDHSGRKGRVNWPKDQANITATLHTITCLCERYAHQEAWLGLAVLNEPKRRIPKRLLRSFYKQAYKIVIGHKADSWVVVSDGFQPWRWYLELPKWRYPNLRLDYHHYQLFRPQDKYRSPESQVREARHVLRRKIWRMSRFHRAIVGEWSLALPAEVYKNYSKAQCDQIARDYAQAQLAAYRHADAWFFWTYKTEAAELWSFRQIHKLLI